MAISLNHKYAPADRYKAVVEHRDGLLVVSAGPGTGKTYSLLRKIESLIEHGVDPSRIYYLTFVNSIVNAFKVDIGKPRDEGGLGVEAGELGIHISTLHSLAFKIVAAYADELDLPAHLEVIDLSPKTQSFLSQIFLKDLFQYSKSVGLIANKKEFYSLLKQLSGTWQKNDKTSGNCEKLEEIVNKFCHRYSVLSWDQLAILAIKAISENGLPKWLRGARHFLIDEYQDFNPAEQRLIELITEPCDSVIIVGDPDQSIYSSRSASPKGLTNLLARDNVQCVNFVFCRRCPKRVIAAANNMLRFMDPEGFSEKELQPFKDETGDLKILSFKSCKAEVKKIAEFIKALNTSDKSDTVILLPAKKAINNYVEKLKESGVNCEVRVTDLSREMLFAMLRLVIIPNQPFLNRVLLNSFESLNKKYRAYALSQYIDSDVEFVDALIRVSKVQKWQRRFIKLLDTFLCTREKIVSLNADSIIQGLAEINLTINESVITNLLASDDSLLPRERVENSFSLIETVPDDETEDNGRIEVLTMHSSKGLSKKFVIIPAFDEKLLPGSNSGERLAEMHRLVYVAITRAKNQVLITFPKTRARRDKLNYGARPKLSRYANILIPHAML